MANIEAWEQRIQDEMAQFANDLNTALGYALAVQDFAHRDDPENVPSLESDDPELLDKLVPRALEHVVMSEAIKRIIEAEELDAKVPSDPMAYIEEFTAGIRVTLHWSPYRNTYRITRELERENEEEHPLVTVSLVFGLDKYLGQYRDIVHLGSCRVCGKIHVKPKHGKKQRYCSRACQQRAYRKRSQGKEEQC